MGVGGFFHHKKFISYLFIKQPFDHIPKNLSLSWAKSS